MELDLFAGLAVTDLDRATAWYERLFDGAESFAPNDTERVWTLAERRHVYIEQEPAHAGHGMVTLFVTDLDAFTASAAGHGIRPESRETYENGVRKHLYRDPDGNQVGIGGAPRQAEE